MKRLCFLAGLGILVAAPLAAQDEGQRPFRYRYRVEVPHRDFARMGRDFGRMGREYGRMGRNLARQYGRDWSRQWRRQDFARGYRNFARDMSRQWGRDWGRWRWYSRRGEI